MGCGPWASSLDLAGSLRNIARVTTTTTSGLRRPTLLSRLRRRRRGLPRKLKLTREGKYLLFLVFGVGFAAINTGNNLLYLVFGLLLSLILVSGVLSELCLRKLTVSVDLPPQLHARRPGLSRVRLRNGKRRFASFHMRRSGPSPKSSLS